VWIGAVVVAAGCAQQANKGMAISAVQGAAGMTSVAPSPSGMAGKAASSTPSTPSINGGNTTAPSASMVGSGGGMSAPSPNTGMNGGAGATAAAAGAGGATGAGTAGVPATGPGGFPKSEAVNTDQKGPHAFMSYTDGLDNPDFNSAVMYYPTDAEPPFASAVFSPGFTATKEQYMNFLGELLASHGIAMMLTTPTTTADQPVQRAMDLESAVEQIKRENERDGSPLKGKLAVDRVCVTGHSMGGGGTLWAATDLGNKIRCAVPLQPWQPGQSFAMITAPTMFIAAQADSVATVASNASLFYDSIPDSVAKYYVEFAGASHFLTTNDLGTAYDGQSKYMIAFYKVYLEDDMRYLDVLNGPMDPELSQYKKSK
jgi:dienelactone hydrolase